jgi:hypothetical protein
MSQNPEKEEPCLLTRRRRLIPLSDRLARAVRSMGLAICAGIARAVGFTSPQRSPRHAPERGIMVGAP